MLFRSHGGNVEFGLIKLPVKRYFIGAEADNLDVLLLKRDSTSDSVRVSHRQLHSEMEARLRAELDVTRKDIATLTAQGALDPLWSTWHFPAAYSWLIVVSLFLIPILVLIARKMCVG